MTDRHDGSSIDLERELVRHLAERRISRRYLLDRIALLGAAAALGPVVAACTGSSATTAPSAAAAGAPAASAPPSSGAASAPAAASSGPTPAPTPGPSPEGELFIYNWADYMGKNVVPAFEKKTGIKVKTDFFDNYDTMLAKIGQGGGGYDLTFPTSTDIPGLLARNLIQPVDHSLLPNLVNLGAEWQNPGYDPGNAHSIPYMWWTTGVAYDTAKVKDKLTSWNALWDAQVRAAHRRARRRPRGLRRGAVPARQEPEHHRRRGPRRGAPARSRSRSRSSGSTPRTTSACSRPATRGSPTPGARTCTRSRANGRR